MKKIYFLLLLLSTGFQVKGQLQIEAGSHTPLIGSNLTYLYIQSFQEGLKPEGNNQTWNLSTAEGIETDMIYVAPSTSANGSAYPTANIMQLADGGEVFYTTNATSMSMLGMIVEASQLSMNYSIPRPFLHYPMGYGDSFTTAYTGTQVIQNSFVYDISGTATIEGAGTGTLVLPYATIPNVLKINAIYHYNMNAQGLSFSYDVVDTISTFYDSNNRYHLASNTVAYSNFGGVFEQGVSSSSYLKEEDFATGLFDHYFRRTDVAVYPNPVADYINIESPFHNEAEYKLYDSRGVLVANGKIQDISYNKIDLSFLGTGIYQLLLLDNVTGESAAKSIVVN